MNFKQKIFSFLTLASTLCLGYDMNEVPEGWASQGKGTTGGKGGEIVTVSTTNQLIRALFFPEPKIVLLKKGVYSGEIQVNANKSILGTEPGVMIEGNIIIDADNVIIRNIALLGPKCRTLEECKEGPDALRVHGKSAENIWLDHLDIYDGQDGNCNITNGANNVTVTWCKFHYTYPHIIGSSNSIGGSDADSTSSENRLNVTYAYNWWADNIIKYMPRGRFGKVHILNNLYTSTRAEGLLGVGLRMQMLIEHNVFHSSGKTVQDYSGESKSASWKSIGNIGTAGDINTNNGTVFTPPYEIKKFEASEVKAKVQEGAGNTMTLKITASKPKPVRKNTIVQPRITASRSGWTLQNSGLSALSFIVVTLRGQTMLPMTILKAGKSFQIPSAASTCLLKFKGVNAPSDIYLVQNSLNFQISSKEVTFCNYLKK